MEIIIEPVVNDEDEAAMLRIRQIVFEREMGIRLEPCPGTFHLLARAGAVGGPVAALSLVDTSSDQSLHEGYGLKLAAGVRVARYTQLAVLKSHRGLNIPLMLMLEAHRKFVAPGRFDYTWLLFDAERAASSLICKWLGFAPGEGTFVSEYGLSRTLLRDERAAQSEQAIRRTGQYVGQMLKSFSTPSQTLVSSVTSL